MPIKLTVKEAKQENTTNVSEVSRSEGQQANWIMTWLHKCQQIFLSVTELYWRRDHSHSCWFVGKPVGISPGADQTDWKLCWMGRSSSCSATGGNTAGDKTILQNVYLEYSCGRLQMFMLDIKCICFDVYSSMHCIHPCPCQLLTHFCISLPSHTNCQGIQPFLVSLINPAHL